MRYIPDPSVKTKHSEEMNTGEFALRFGTAIPADWGVHNYVHFPREIKCSYYYPMLSSKLLPNWHGLFEVSWQEGDEVRRTETGNSSPKTIAEVGHFGGDSS